jgi:hypothetical protein
VLVVLRQICDQYAYRHDRPWCFWPRQRSSTSRTREPRAERTERAVSEGVTKRCGPS